MMLRLFGKRALNYKNVWDENSGWMRPRQLDGNWIEPFNPILSHHGFVESTATQSTWFVPHDMKGFFVSWVALISGLKIKPAIPDFGCS